MKLNRLVALGAIVLLGAGAMGFSSKRASAQAAQPTAPAAVQSQDCSQDQADSADVKSAAPDTDAVDLQCGDQSGTDTQETVGAADTGNAGEQVGDQTGSDTGVEATEADSPAGQ